jgi:hypothetical protein
MLGRRLKSGYKFRGGPMSSDVISGRGGFDRAWIQDRFSQGRQPRGREQRQGVDSETPAAESRRGRGRRRGRDVQVSPVPNPPSPSPTPPTNATQPPSTTQPSTSSGTLAERYVAQYEAQAGVTLSAEQRAAKVAEVSEFYSQGTRSGRLSSIVFA